MKKEKNSSLAFSREVASRLGGETINLCYQCGTCASSCPVAKITPRFNPREVIKLVFLGEREEILSGDAIWLCCSCYNCQERCPQKVEIADVIYALRNMAIMERHVPDIYSEFTSALNNYGRLARVSAFVEKKRSLYGLPPIKPAGLKPLKKILSTVGMNKLQRKEEET